MQNIHIGKKIKARVEERGMNVTEFAKRLGRTSQSVYHIFGSASIDTALLQDIGEVLETDFFRFYVKEKETGPVEAKLKNKRKMSLLIDIDDIDQQTVQNLRDVCLGNGRRIQFKSARVAAKFIADTNRYLTKCLVILNETYIDVFAEYRRVWFVTANTNTGTRTNYRDKETAIKKALESADFMFNKFNATNWGSNDPFFAFIDLRKIALFLKDAADVLTEFHRNRDHTAQYHACQVLADRCQAVVKRLDEYDYQ
jgi:transcriptional regulator with XRE-family HTH domain